MSQTPRARILPCYLPAIFCGLLTVFSLFGGDATRIVLVSFLPMCFLFVGFVLHDQYRRIAALERPPADPEPARRSDAGG